MLRIVGVEFDPLPCDDGCKFRTRCASEKRACEAFSMYLARESKARWSKAPRAPTTALFSAIFDSPTPRGGRRPVHVRDKDAPPRRIAP